MLPENLDEVRTRQGYQISQYTPVFPPLTVNGYLDIETEAGTKRIGVNRAHLEEDTGKLYQVGDASLVVEQNANRALRLTG
jgi:aspartyl-tRNA(Asn)/glutamyl-tRNA(Gln) amidotransferase subunit B